MLQCTRYSDADL